MLFCIDAAAKISEISFFGSCLTVAISAYVPTFSSSSVLFTNDGNSIEFNWQKKHNQTRQIS